MGIEPSIETRGPANVSFTFRIGSTTGASATAGLELRIIPTEPLTGVAPGQTAVIYLGTRVLGQFTIDRTVSAVPVAAAHA